MINKDGGGGGKFLDFMGGTAVMRGDIKLMGDPPVPPTRENPELSGTKISDLSLIV